MTTCTTKDVLSRKRAVSFKTSICMTEILMLIITITFKEINALSIGGPKSTRGVEMKKKLYFCDSDTPRRVTQITSERIVVKKKIAIHNQQF